MQRVVLSEACKGERSIIGRIDYYQFPRENAQTTIVPYADPKITYDDEVRADGKRTGVVETQSHAVASGVGNFIDTHTIHYTYDALGRLIVEDFDFSRAGFLTAIPPIEDFATTYTFDLAGNRIEVSKDLGRDGSIDEKIVSLYDANDRLLSADRYIPDPANSGQFTLQQSTVYHYDGTQQTGESTCRTPLMGEDSLASMWSPALRRLKVCHSGWVTVEMSGGRSSGRSKTWHHGGSWRRTRRRPAGRSVR